MRQLQLILPMQFARDIFTLLCKENVWYQSRIYAKDETMKNMFLLAVVMTTLLTTTFSIMPLQADPPIAGFTQYGNKYFIETGTCVGSGLQLAVDAGFEVLHSIELAVPFYIQARRRFANTPNVNLWYGDSSKVLPQILRLVDAPATFWLDGHYSGGHTARGTK